MLHFKSLPRWAHVDELYALIQARTDILRGYPRGTQRLRPGTRHAHPRILKRCTGLALRLSGNAHTHHSSFVASRITHPSFRRMSSITSSCTASLFFRAACRCRWPPVRRLARCRGGRSLGPVAACCCCSSASLPAAYPSIVCADSDAAPRTSAAELPAALSAPLGAAGCGTKG